jgi:sulfite oxidase
LDRSWAWTFWDCEVDIPESAVHSAVQLVCKATDASYNVQPDTVRGIWNLRGINNNAWHRVNVNVVPEDETEDDM